MLGKLNSRRLNLMTSKKIQLKISGFIQFGLQAKTVI